MIYNNYKTFNTKLNNNILTVSFNNPPVNILDLNMLNDLNNLCDLLNNDTYTKVVVFESLNEMFFIAHYDIEILKDLSTKEIEYKDIKTSYLQNTLQRITSLKQCTIAKVCGFARGGGHELCLACDLRYASSSAIFMQMEVGMGILPCGGGSSRLAKIVGVTKALEMVLSARDYNAYEAYELGTLNKVLPKDEIDSYVETIANRISKFPLESINSCKKTIYNSVDTSLLESLKYEEYELYQALSKTPAIKRFQYASSINFQNNVRNQVDFENQLIQLQKIV